MPTIRELCDFLARFAPPRLAEEWDNVGLLLGCASERVDRVMTCLTLTPASAAEAVAEGAGLVVAHHPLPFRPLRRITTDETPGRLVWQLAGAKVAVYSVHTAFDSAAQGINHRLAERIGLGNVQVLRPREGDPENLGAGRWGVLPQPEPLAALAGRARQLFAQERISVAGARDLLVERVAVACGSGGDFLAAAHAAGCQCLVTGEANFHTALEAESLGLGLVLLGHYASERLGVEYLAETLGENFPGLKVWASRREADPLWSA